MNLKRDIAIFALIFITANVFSQIQESRKIMYVTSEEGLRIRSGPSIDNERVGILLFGQRLVTYSRTNYTVTVDGITDYWYSIDYSNEKWVFGRYISEDFPEKAPVVLGLWDDINNDRLYHNFSPDHSYAAGRKETDMGFWGRWYLNGTTITIHLTGAGNEYVLDETYTIQLVIIDKNNIILKLPNNETVRLKRSQDLW
ncbi:MAG: SH3 domain-containing protein [Treponema sp.]|jgi:hypothetical protein|nr:SH3 domain-containing protein [Treponema sp.]